MPSTDVRAKSDNGDSVKAPSASTVLPVLDCGDSVRGGDPEVRGVAADGAGQVYVAAGDAADILWLIQNDGRGRTLFLHRDGAQIFRLPGSKSRA